MTVPAEARAHIERWCVEQSEPEHADIVRTGARFRGNTVVISEQRCDFDDDGEWVDLPSARLRLDPAIGRWDLAWHRANGRWEPYPDWQPSSLSTCLDEIADDPFCVFWG